MRANLNTISANAAAYNANVDTLSTSTIYPVNSEIAMLALNANIGDAATRSDNKLTYILTATPASNLANWSQLNFPVDSVPLLNGVATPTSGAMSGGPIIDHIHTNFTILNNTTASYTAADQSKLASIAPSATANQTDTFLLDRANHTGTQLASTIIDFTANVNSNPLVSGAVQSSSIGVANGVASLDGAGIIPTSQLPALAITNTKVVASQSAMLALTAQPGDIAIRTDLSKTFILTSTGASTLANWQEVLTPTDLITSVNGQIGAVNLISTNIPEGSNLYYTEARVSSNVSVVSATTHAGSTGNPHNATTANIPEGSNLYYTEARVAANTAVTANTAHASSTGNPHGATTGDIAETSNLYFTNARVTNNAAVVANTAHAASTGNPHNAITTDIPEGVNLYYTDARVSANATVAANTAARHVHANANILNATTASYTTSEQSKLQSINLGATKNQSDSFLTNRANHTGTQLAATISDFAAAVASTHPYATNAQAIAGTAVNVGMTPANTRASIVDSKHIIAMNYALA